MHSIPSPFVVINTFLVSIHYNIPHKRKCEIFNNVSRVCLRSYLLPKSTSQIENNVNLQRNYCYTDADVNAYCLDKCKCAWKIWL